MCMNVQKMHVALSELQLPNGGTDTLRRVGISANAVKVYIKGRITALDAVRDWRGNECPD